jgi:two-component sensor histidine kinase
MARKYGEKSLFAKAEKLLEQCLSYGFSAKNPLYECKIHIELGALYKLLGEYRSALHHTQKARTLAEVLSAWKEFVISEVQMAEYFRHLSKFREAGQYIGSALNNYSRYKIQDTVLLISIYNRAAAIENESNHNPAATFRNSRMALALAIRSGNKPAEAVSLNELGFTYKNLRKIDSADFFYRQAEKIWNSIGAYREAMHVMSNRIMLYAHSNYPKEEIAQMYKNLIHIISTQNIDYPLKDAYGFLSDYYGRKGDSAESFRYYKKLHVEVFADIKARNDLQIINMTERYESEKAKKQVTKVEGELQESQEELQQKKVENTRAYIFLALLITLIGAIVFLLVRINRANKKLKKRNKEKDALIQEIHHRVKNNLQFISSLVNMQMNSSTNNTEIDTLNDASRRIKAMALVHEMLYNQPDSAGINIQKYLEELIASLSDVVNSGNIPIRFNMHLIDADFNISQSIALGMIVSELVSNSMKYAFYGVADPEIEIVLERQASNQFTFRLADNGAGLPETAGNKKSLGMRLIDIFSRQLKGKYRFFNSNGLTYEMTFNVK